MNEHVNSVIATTLQSFWNGPREIDVTERIEALREAEYERRRMVHPDPSDPDHPDEPEVFA